MSKDSYSINTNATTSMAKFDFSKYRRPELTEQVADLVSLPATIGTILTWGAIALVATWLVLPSIFAGRVHWTVFACVMAYGTLMAVIIGVMLGVAAKLSQSFEDLSSIVTTSVGVAEEVSDDIALMRDGNVEVPTGEETLTGVYDHVILPMVQAGMVRNGLVLGQVGFWVYRWTLNRILKRMIREIGSDDRASSPSEAMDNINGAADRATVWLKSAHGYLGGVGNVVRRVAWWPIAILMTVFIVALSLPLVAVWFWA